jgi:hypothetical protein
MTARDEPQLRDKLALDVEYRVRRGDSAYAIVDAVLAPLSAELDRLRALVEHLVEEASYAGLHTPRFCDKCNPKEQA